MTTSFKNILLPVDFTFNTQVAVKKAMELIEPDDAVIHLLHVIKPPFSLPLPIWNVKKTDDALCAEVTQKLQQWKRVMEESLENIQVYYEVAVDADITRAIIAKAIQLKPDLILLGEHKQRSPFSFKRNVAPNRIALRTGFPLMILKPGCIYNKVKSVVVPVAGFTPQRKIELLMALKRRFRMRVHLVTIMDDRETGNDFSAQALLDTYRILKNNLQFQVEYQVLHGTNRAKASLQYAQSVGADMLLVNPDTETKITSLTGMHINDMLVPESRLQILEVEPKK